MTVLHRPTGTIGRNYIRSVMGKLVSKPKTTRSKRKPKTTRTKRRISNVMHLFGSVPGMDKWAIPQLKKMRDEW